jgi:prepilin-type N-terminal cleavage/methylation domain-containing protein
VNSRQQPRGQRDAGFTLVEMIVVMGLMALLSGLLATVFVVILRSTPDADDRVSDARSVQGLVTWLPQDIDAAPPDRFDRDVATWPCAGTTPADSYNVLTVGWTETIDSVTSADYSTSYRYELIDTEWRMVRYTCVDAGAARGHNMTSELSPWGAPAPVSVQMCSSEVDEVTGQCATADIIPDTVTAPPVVRSIQIAFTHPDGDVSTIDAAPKNPDEELADDPDAVTNDAPVATSSNITRQINQGATEVLYIDVTHGVTDPESNALTAAVNSFEPAPANVTVSTADPLEVSITADPTAPPGVIADDLVLVVSDSYGGSVTVTVTIEILAPPNNPPIATAPAYALAIEASDSVLLPLGVTHGVSDPDGDPLTLSVLGWPSSLLTGPPATGSPLVDPLDMVITTGSTIATATTPIDVRVTDPDGLYVDIQIWIDVIVPIGNNAPTVPIPNVDVTMYAGDTVTVSVVDPLGHAAFDPDGHAIYGTVDGAAVAPADITTTTSGLDVTIETDPTIVDGVVVDPVSLLVTDIYGASTPATITIEILPTPPPPSDCVLGTLTTNPVTGDRIGGGGSAPKTLSAPVTVTLTYTGTCDGLTLNYDTGHATGLGIVGRVFPGGSPTSILLVNDSGGGTEKWRPGVHTLTASTTTAVTPNTVTYDLNIT